MTLQEKLRQLPTQSGVYIYYDVNGRVLYVGKAKNLKNRVRQYFFDTGAKPYKVSVMLKYVADMEYILTSSETDAFALENTLIKKYNPPYNILLKDDKQYPFVKIDMRQSFPRLVVTRKVLKDKAKYFGPIMGGIKELLALLEELYPTRTCNVDMDNLPKNFRPCLNFHIGKCCAPCAGKVTKQEYQKLIDGCCRFLKGDTGDAQKIIRQKMQKASDEERFEDALRYKQQLKLVDSLNDTRVVTLGKLVDYDVFSIASDGTQSVVNVTVVRGGRVLSSSNTSVSDAGIDEKQTLSAFLNAYYSDCNDAAKEVLLDRHIEGEQDFALLLTEKYGKKITVGVPQKGTKKQLSDMSAQNSAEYLKKSFAREEREYAATTGAVVQLKELLGLKSEPKRIECFDISNISGVDKVASMVVTVDGKKSPKDYRRFKIRTVEGANDFACMKEVILRRLERLKRGDERFGAKPDLFVIDGGLGQLGYVKEAMQESGISIETVSLAKREELVYTLKNNEPIRLPLNSYALKVLINTRDEAHRFAITYFRKLHGKNAFKSQLDEIEGVGQKRQTALIKKFGSLSALKTATVEQIAATDGISTNTAQKIYDYFHKDLPQDAPQK